MSAEPLCLFVFIVDSKNALEAHAQYTCDALSEVRRTLSLGCLTIILGFVRVRLANWQCNTKLHLERTVPSLQAQR